MYLLKHSRPSLSNCIRECTKVMHCANKESEKEMRRIIQYVLATKRRGLKMKPSIIFDK